jgi:hypothetical protein
MTTGRRKNGGSHAQVEAERKRVRILELVANGASVQEALQGTNTSRGQYEKWRSRWPEWRVALDEQRTTVAGPVDGMDMSHAAFSLRYFGIDYAPFQLDFIERMEALPPGDILLALWPPEHGKTTVFENYASQKLAQFPEHRFTVASGSQRIASKITGRVRRRMSTGGSASDFVRDWGPFEPQTGVGRKGGQPWHDGYFNVYKKSAHDERDNSMQAIGRDTEIVSTRTDHLHVDDLQSTKTIKLTDKLVEWFRQDALSRPGEYGKTSAAATRVGEDDVWGRLMDDEDLDGILHVVKYPALVTNSETGELEPLFPQRYSLEQLMRMKAKSGQEPWDRGYMQEPGASGVDRPIDDDAIERCKDHGRRWRDTITQGAQHIITVDPALGGWSCVMGWEISEAKQLCAVRLDERRGLQRNEQIMEQIGRVLMDIKGGGGRITDVIIETMNFQKGLARDERLLKLRDEHGFALRDHLTGWNKYDVAVGIGSMAADIRAGEIRIPYFGDSEHRGTQLESDELFRQWKKWKNGTALRGNKVRIDRLMTTWFAWIWWQKRYKTAVTEQESSTSWKRNGLPFKRTDVGLIVPMNYKVAG